MKKFLKYLLGFLLLLFLLLAIVFFYRREILQFTLEEFLSSQGQEITALKVEELSTGEIHIEEFSTRFELAGQSIDADLRDIKISTGFELFSFRLQPVLSIRKARVLVSPGASRPMDAGPEDFSFESIPMGELHIEELALQFSSSTRNIAVLWDVTFKKEALDKLSLNIASKDYTGKEYFRSLLLQASFPEGKLEEASGNVSLTALNLFPEKELPHPDLKGSFSLTPKQFELISEAVFPEISETPLQASLNYEPGQGKGRFELQHEKLPLDRCLEISRVFLPDFSLLKNISEGEGGAAVKGTFHSGALKTLSLDASIHNGETELFTGTQLEGVEAELELSLLPVFSSTAPIEFSADRLWHGVELQNLQGVLNIKSLPEKQPVFEFQNLRVEFLSGTLSSEEIVYNPGKTSQKFKLTLRGIDLEELLKLHPQESVSGTGRLDLDLPMTITQGAVIVDGGRLESRAPGGRIRFQPEDPESYSRMHPGMATAMKALKNFQYNSLSAQISYQQNGDLILATQLKGKGLEMNIDQPVHVNLQLEENIPALLRSLRLASELGSSIEQRLNEDR